MTVILGYTLIRWQHHCNRYLLDLQAAPAVPVNVQTLPDSALCTDYWFKDSSDSTESNISLVTPSIVNESNNSYNVSLYFDIFGELTAVTFSEYCEWDIDDTIDSEFIFFKMDTTHGDQGNDRIDWGFMHFGVNTTDKINGYTINNSSFARSMMLWVTYDS